MGSDQQALREFDAQYPRLVAVAYQAAHRFFRYDGSLVDDAVAETMVRVFERWEKVRRHENPDGWVVVCAKNVCLEHLRVFTRRPKRTPMRQDDIVIDLTEDVSTSEVVAAALDQLTKRQRDVAVLRYLMDFDEAMTANALGTSPAKVKAAAHEARGRLRVLLTDTYLDLEEQPQ